MDTERIHEDRAGKRFCGRPQPAQSKRTRFVRSIGRLRLGRALILAAAIGVPLFAAAYVPLAANAAEERGASDSAATEIEGLSALKMPEGDLAPEGAAIAGDGGLVLADSMEKRIFLVKDGETETLAGAKGAEDIYGEPSGGYADGEAKEARFAQPLSVAFYNGGWLVSDAKNGALRWIYKGEVKTLDVSSKLKRPAGLAADRKGHVYVSDAGEGRIIAVSTEGGERTIAEGLEAPTAMCCKKGSLYIAETGANRILKLDLKKVASSSSLVEPEVVAGSRESGFADGDAGKAAFSSPQGIAANKRGVVFVSDTANAALRRIQNGKVDTLISKDPASMSTDFVSPKGLVLSHKKLYICDPFGGDVYIFDLSR